MFWNVHWMNYDDENDERVIDDFEYIVKHSEYQAAFGDYIQCISNSDIARCWVTVHRNEADTDGNIMLAYANDWNDNIILTW